MVENDTSSVEYQLSTSTGPFSIPFYFIENGHIVAELYTQNGDDFNKTTLTIDVDYYLNGAGDKNGGQLTLLSAHSGATLLIYRDPDATQLTSYLATGKFPATSHERALDKLTMLIQKFGWWWDSLALKKPNIFANYYDALNNRIRNLRDPSQAQDAATKNYVDLADNYLQQQIASNFKRSLRVPDSSINQLPSAEERAWKGLGFDGAGQPKLQDPAGTGLWGYVPAIGSFEKGSLLTQRFEVLLWESTDEYWRWDGAMPKIVLPGSTPDTAGGRGKGKWIDVTDATLRSNLGSGEEGMGDALLAVKQPFDGAVARTQHDKNAEFVSLDDAGGDRNSFDPETLELLVKAVANQLRIPYLGAQQFALPGQTLKAWRYMDGFKDRGAVASFMSVDSPDSSEPTTQVLGLAEASALGKYSDRDTVVLFAQAEGQPPLLATSNTTFTATTVTSPDFATVADKLRRKQIIDVVDANTPSNIYSGWIVAYDAQTNTITVDTAWYLKGGNGVTTGTPSSGSSLKLVPNTKIWGQNTNVILKPTSDARDFAGFELGLYNNKTNSPVGYGYDAYSGGTYTVLNGFQARGKLYCGFRNYAQGDYGYIGGGHQYGYYDSGSERGLFAWNNTYGVNIKSPTSYAIILQDSSNAFITGMDKDGKWQGLKYYTTTVSPGGSISQYSTVAFVTPTAASQTVTLPAHSAGKVIYVRNLSSSYSISCVGAMEGASGAIALAAKTTIQLVSDGTYWYPIGKYSA